MDLKAVIADDFLAVTDGLEVVGLVNLAGIQVGSAEALRRAISTNEAEASNGAYTQADTRFHVAANPVTRLLRPGWKLVDSAGTWTILETGLETLTNRIKTVARNLTLFYQLTEDIGIQTATWAKDADGAQVATWATTSTVAGRVQYLKAESENQHGLRYQPKQVTVFLESQIRLTESQRLKVGALILNVKGWKNPETLGDVFALDCEVSPWPLN